jgi:transcriptional regulator with XRE-family HTH domain
MYVAGKCLLLRRLKERNMTQQDLAEKIQMSASQINDYIHNRKKTMSLSNAKTIANALDCTIDDLYEWVYVRR